MEKDTRQLDPGKGTAAEEFTLWRLFTSFFRIGLLTIGGGLAMVPQMERICVTEKKWLSPEDMIDCLALAQALPGVLAINSATFIGNKLRGLRGALVATLAVILPSFLIILCVVNILGYIGDEPHIQGAMTGIKAAVCGSIVAVAYRMGKRILKDVFGWIMAVGAFVAIAVLHIDTALVIVCAAVLGILYQMIRTKTKGPDKSPDGEEAKS